MLGALAEAASIQAFKYTLALKREISMIKRTLALKERSSRALKDHLQDFKCGDRVQSIRVYRGQRGPGPWRCERCRKAREAKRDAEYAKQSFQEKRKRLSSSPAELKDF